MSGNFTIRRFWPAVLLVGLTILFFAPVFFSGQLFFHRDLFFFHYPLRHYWVTNLEKAGDLPFLNVALNGGQPILSNPNFAVFYPGNILYFILPFDTAWNWTLGGHVLWASIGLFWLARRLHCTRIAALTGAIVFGFSGPLLSALSYYNILIAASWIPWIVGLTLRACQKRGRAVGVAMLAVAAQLLAGEPTVQMITLGLMAVSVMLLHRKSSAVPPLTGILIGALLLAAIQLVPAILWLPHSARAGGLDFRLSSAYWSLHPARLIEILIPHFYGYPMSDYSSDFWGGVFSDEGFPYFPKIYVGWLSLLLCGFAWQNRWGKASLILMVLGLLLSMGHWIPGYRLLFDSLSVFRLIRYPEKFLLLFSFGLALAAAIGMNELLNSPDRRKGYATGMALLVVVLFAFLKPWPGNVLPHQHAIRNHASLLAAASGTVSLLLLYLSRRYGSAIRIVIPIVLFMDLGSITWDVAQTEPRSNIQSKPTVLEQVPEITKRSLLHLGEAQSDVYFNTNLRPTMFMHHALHPLTGLRWGINYGATTDIDRLGWLMADRRTQQILDRVRKSENLGLMRRAGIQFVVSLSALSHNELKLLKTARISEGVPVSVYELNPPAFPMVHWEKGEGEFRWLRHAPNHLFVYTSSREGGQLIVQRNAIPGWRCEENGKRIPIGTSEDGWLRIPVPPGAHQMELIYQPPGLIVGTVLTAAGILLVLTLLVLF